MRSDALLSGIKALDLELGLISEHIFIPRQGVADGDHKQPRMPF